MVDKEKPRYVKPKITARSILEDRLNHAIVRGDKPEIAGLRNEIAKIKKKWIESLLRRRHGVE